MFLAKKEMNSNANPDGKEKVKEALEEKNEFLKTLPNDIVIYPGHGPKSTIGHEKMMNYYLNHPLSL